MSFIDSLSSPFFGDLPPPPSQLFETQEGPSLFDGEEGAISPWNENWLDELGSPFVLGVDVMIPDKNPLVGISEGDLSAFDSSREEDIYIRIKDFLRTKSLVRNGETIKRQNCTLKRSIKHSLPPDLQTFARTYEDRFNQCFDKALRAVKNERASLNEVNSEKQATTFFAANSKKLLDDEPSQQSIPNKEGSNFSSEEPDLSRNDGVSKKFPCSLKDLCKDSVKHPVIFSKIKECMRMHWQSCLKTKKNRKNFLRKKIYAKYPELNPHHPTFKVAKIVLSHCFSDAYKMILVEEMESWLSKLFSEGQFTSNTPSQHILQELKNWISNQKWSEDATFSKDNLLSLIKNKQIDSLQETPSSSEIGSSQTSSSMELVGNTGIQEGSNPTAISSLANTPKKRKNYRPKYSLFSKDQISALQADLIAIISQNWDKIYVPEPTFFELRNKILNLLPQRLMDFKKTFATLFGKYLKKSFEEVCQKKLKNQELKQL